MKRIVFLSLLFSVALLFGCKDTAKDDPVVKRNIKETEVLIYSGGNQLAETKAIDWKSDIGFNTPDNGRYLVYYFIRIDGNIPGEDEVNLPAKEYFPRTKANKSMISDLNHGYVDANTNWRTNSKFSKYIYSTDGSSIQSIILEEPTLEDLAKADQGTGDDFSGYIKRKDELHFLWYACKKQTSDHVWHIDGVLTSKDKTDIAQTDYGKEIMDKYKEYGMVIDQGSVKRTAHVEIDVHQQDHKDWNEIKTSIHLRDTVDVELLLPIDYQAQADDFNIRIGEDYEYVTELKSASIQIEGNTYELKVDIQHLPEGIKIIVHPNKEALIAARKVYDDGITFEVHSYVTNGIPNAVIWDKLKKTTVKTTPYTSIRGQITSVFYDDEVKL